MLPLAVAVSLDALIVGVTFSAGTVSLIEGDLALAVANFVAGFLGMYIGYKFGMKFGKIAVIVGGVLLILNAFLALFEVV
jgi:putative Mn2+ efflux pump MntP